MFAGPCLCLWDLFGIAQPAGVAAGGVRPARLARASRARLPLHDTGHLHDDLSLRALYSAADVMVVPSRQDNLPNTGLEAHACGTPVVAFNTGGLPDIVSDRVTGALAEPFQPASLAAAIRWVLQDPQRHQSLSRAARRRAEELWNPARVAALYADYYRQAIDRQRSAADGNFQR